MLLEWNISLFFLSSGWIQTQARIVSMKHLINVSIQRIKLKKIYILLLRYGSSAHQDGSICWVIAGAMDAQQNYVEYRSYSLSRYNDVNWIKNNELIPNRYTNWDLIQTTSIIYGSIGLVSHGEFSGFYQWYMFYTVILGVVVYTVLHQTKSSN